MGRDDAATGLGGDGGTVKAVYAEQQVDGQSYSVVFTYVIDGHYYGGTFTSWSNKLVVGDAIFVKYDPYNPERNDLVARETTMRWVLGLVIAIGIIVFLIVQG